MIKSPLSSVLGAAALVACGLCGGAATAHADDLIALAQPSPQHFALEIKFGPYVPNIDASKGADGRTPFSDQFGDPADPKGARPSRGLISQVEFDYQFFNKFGSLGIGLSGGYYKTSGRAFSVVGNESCVVKDDGNGNRAYYLPSDPNRNPALTYDNCISGDTNDFNMVPLALLAVYRFDVLDKKWRVPIIPYVKVGLAYYIWWFGNSGSFVSDLVPPGQTDSVKAAGGSFGVVVNPGIAIDLSVLDPKAARAIDQEIGLNRVTAFVEMNGAFVDGFGRDNKLNLSDLSLSAGLGFEF